ncbi:MAG: hypothetical protein HQ481_02045 [Alphaproteobacteria bacterium]|nr:hypothetical protein [Alphaproteobacteria bacterium]
MIDITAYDVIERRRRLDFGTGVNMAFAPVTFRERGFPDRIDDYAELPQFTENMNLLAGPNPWLEAMRVTMLEAAILNNVNAAVLDFNARACGKRIAPLSSSATMLPLLRFLTAFADRFHDGRLNVLEIGPGAGYLGLMLAQAGHRYVATDATQSFYIWQNALWEHVMPGAVTETAFDDAPPTTLKTHITHLPWWHFAKLRDGFDWNIDVVVSKAVLAETHSFFQRFLFRLSELLLRGDRPKAFVFDGVGAQTHGNRADIHRLLLDYGYHALNAPELVTKGLDRRLNSRIDVYAPRGSLLHAHGSAEIERERLPDILQGITPNTPLSDGDDTVHSIGQVLDIDPDVAYPDYEFFEFLGTRTAYSGRK